MSKDGLVLSLIRVDVVVSSDTHRGRLRRGRRGEGRSLPATNRVHESRPTMIGEDSHPDLPEPRKESGPRVGAVEFR